MFRLLLNQKRQGVSQFNKNSWSNHNCGMRMTKRRKREMCVDVEKEEKREKMWAGKI